MCEACDRPCATCEGAGPYNADPALSNVGLAGAKFKCTSCDPAYPFLLDEVLDDGTRLQECYPACLSGMYTKEERDDHVAACGLCKAPCSTCRKCYAEDTAVTI